MAAGKRNTEEGGEMTTITRQCADRWHARHRHCIWNSVPTGLGKYCRFIGNSGFLIYGGFGWVRLHTLDFATQLMYSRKHGANWRKLWKHRAYAK